MNINPDDITAHYKTLFSHVSNKEFDEINTLMKSYDVSQLNLVVLVGIPRLTFLLRDNINEWPDFLEKAKTEIIARGENPDDLLSGLL